MAFMNYYVGVHNKSYEFYSKKELLEFLQTPDVYNEVENDNITIIKENEKSRVFYSFDAEKGLFKVYREVMVDGAYGG